MSLLCQRTTQGALRDPELCHVTASQYFKYAEGVVHRSPGSRSAPWVVTTGKRLRRRRYTTPEETLFNAFSVSHLFGELPRVRCATLGSVV